MWIATGCMRAYMGVCMHAWVHACMYGCVCVHGCVCVCKSSSKRLLE